MGLTRPTGGHADRMLEPGGWPDADEGVLHDRAAEFAGVLREVTAVLETCQRERMRVFAGGVWSGGAATAAERDLEARIDQLTALRDGVSTVIGWHDAVARTITMAKAAIGDNVEATHRRIEVIATNAALDAAERRAAIDAAVLAAYGANTGIVAAAAVEIRSTRTWASPEVSPRPTFADAPATPGTPGSGPETPGTPAGPGSPTAPGGPTTGLPTTGTPRPGDRAPGATPTPAVPSVRPPDGNPPLSRPDSENPGDSRPDGSAPAAPGMPVLPGLPSGMIPPQMPGVPPTGRPAPPPSDDDAETPEGEIGPAVEESEILEPGVQPPAAAGPGDVESGGGAGPAPATSDVGRGVTPASVSAAPVLPSVGPTRGEETTGQAAPVASAGGAGGMMPAGAAGAGGSGRSGGVAPANRAPLAPHPTQRPAAPRATASNAPRGPVDPPDRPAATVEPPLVAAIPVSVARAERDAIAAANAARRSDAPDALRTARLVAAALNAPGALGATDFGFFWVTGVTTDDDVVVANSYGIGYVPQGVELPEPVVLVSADDAIPIAKRAAWATYPFVAVQEWAAHHGKTLRAIIATEAQFAGVDPGAAKVVLAPDDIPDDGAMGGRSRLLVTDPAAAQKLAATSDGELNRLLPQTATSAVPPADRRMDLWFEVMKPLTSSAEGRETAHLKAFRTYVENAYDVALDAAHAATEPTAKRRATADVMYWGYVCDLLDDALAPASSPH